MSNLQRREEILAVKRLGENIGYGNMMDIASALWAICLQENYSSPDPTAILKGKYDAELGAFVPTIAGAGFMLKKEAKGALARREARKAEIKRNL